MMGSYDSDRTMVRWPMVRHRLARFGAIALAASAVLLAAAPAAARQAPAAAPAAAPATPAVDIPPGGPSVRLQLRVFDGMSDVTRDIRVRLYPAGRRGAPLKLTLSPDRAYEADVPIGLYDVQAVRMRGGSVAVVRWVEHMLVQQYPDEYGRHLQVINLRDGFGALQIRPDRPDAGPAGWSAVATPPGVAGHRGRQGPCARTDLLLVVPAGTYDVKVRPSQRAAGVAHRHRHPRRPDRLKTWPFK